MAHNIWPELNKMKDVLDHLSPFQEGEALQILHEACIFLCTQWLLYLGMVFSSVHAVGVVYFFTLQK